MDLLERRGLRIRSQFRRILVVVAPAQNGGDLLDDAAADAELSAFSDVCAYRCNSLEEAKLKAKYLITTYMVRDGWDDEAIALLKSFSAT